MVAWLVAAVVALLLAFVLFEYVTDYFVDGMGSVGRIFDVPEAVLGASVAAIGSSLPELFTSLSSVFLEHPVIGLGTIVGSAVFNVTIILAAAGWTRHCELDPHVILRDAGAYAVVIIVMGASILDGEISRFEAVVWLASYLLYFGWLVYDALEGEHVPREDVEYVGVRRAIGYLAIGIAGIGVLSTVVVESSLFITDFFGLAESVFALLVIALGTSVPDLFTSMSAAERGYGSMAMSNAIGSNVFDILVGLGLPLSILASSTNVSGDISTSVGLLFASIALAGGLMLWGMSISRRDAVALTAFYAGYVTLLLGGVL